MFETLKGWYDKGIGQHHVTPLGFLSFLVLSYCYNHVTPLGLVRFGILQIPQNLFIVVFGILRIDMGKMVFGILIFPKK